MDKIIIRSFSIVIFLCLPHFVTQGYQSPKQKAERASSLIIQSGVYYDARIFLSKTQQNIFNKLYPKFDEPRAIKDWQWKDVDPLGVYTSEENRKRRRELFLFEYSTYAMDESEGALTPGQEAFKTVLSKRFEDSTILMTKSLLKIITAYTDRYEDKLPKRNLLEKTSQLGIEWAEIGGERLYIYNGAILLSKFKNGYVELANLNIDMPAMKTNRK